MRWLTSIILSGIVLSGAFGMAGCGHSLENGGVADASSQVSTHVSDDKSPQSDKDSQVSEGQEEEENMKTPDESGKSCHNVMLTLNNGLQIPQLGIGTYRSSVEEAKSAVASALQVCYRHVDTAHAYQNERGVGAAVRESGIPREEIWITSKLWPTDYDSGNVDASIDKMLQRLDTDYIDLVYLHQCVGNYMAGYRGLEKAVNAGKVRAIGLSNFDMREDFFDDVIAKAEIKPAIVQIELHPYAQRKAFRKKCADLGIAVEGWFPLGGTHGGNDVLFADSTIQELAQKYGKTPAQIILRWHIQEGFSTIPGSRNASHIAENYEVYEFELTEEDMDKIRALDKEARFYTTSWEQQQSFANWRP